MPSLLLSILLLLLSPTLIYGFANNLVDSASGCLIDLSTDEVIMNNQVVSWNDSSNPELYLAVDQDGVLKRGPIVINDKSNQYAIKLVDPNNRLSDVQYVVETTQGAKFTHGGCEDQKRISSRMHNDPGVVLEILDITQSPIKLLAGWATGHEAVQLTEELVFVVASGSEEAAGGDTAAEEKRGLEEEQEHPIMEMELEEPEEKVYDSKQMDAQVDKEYEELLQANKLDMKDLQRRASRHVQDKLKDTLKNIDLKQQENKEVKETAGGRNKRKNRRNNNKDFKEKLNRREEILNRRKKELLLNDEGLKKKERTTSSSSKFESFSDKYNHDKYGDGGEFSLQSYGYGVIFFVFTSAFVLQACLWTSNSKHNKGRRDL